MQTEIEAEAERAKDMYEKFMCYCDTNIKSAESEIADATDLVPPRGKEVHVPRNPRGWDQHRKATTASLSA